MYERRKEHRKDGKDKAEDSHQWKHWMMEHPELEGDPQFRFKVVSSSENEIFDEKEKGFELLSSIFFLQITLAYF